MAAFIIGTVGYGFGVVAIAMTVHGFIEYGKAETRERRLSYLGAAAISATVAVLFALATHWSLKVAL